MLGVSGAIGVGLLAAPFVSAQSAAQEQERAGLNLVVGEPLEFGRVVVPHKGACRYEISTSGKSSATGETECAFLTPPFPGAFEIHCKPGVSIEIDIASMPHGDASGHVGQVQFVWAIDGSAPGADTRPFACGRDGRSDLKVGAVIVVEHGAQAAGPHLAGAIQLRAQYLEFQEL